MLINLNRARKALNILTHESEDTSYVINKHIGFHLNEDQACNAFIANLLEGSTAVQTQLDIIRAVYDLRALISKANHTSGIESLMNEQRRLMKEDSVFQNVISRASKTVNTIEEFKAKFNYEISSKTSNGYAASSIITCSSVSPQCVELCVSESKSIKKRLMAIEDQLAQLNNSTTIVVDNATHQILLDHDLI